MIKLHLEGHHPIYFVASHIVCVKTSPTLAGGTRVICVDDRLGDVVEPLEEVVEKIEDAL